MRIYYMDVYRVTKREEEGRSVRDTLHLLVYPYIALGTRAGHGGAKAGESRSHMVGEEAQALGLSSAAFPGTLTGASLEGK